MPSAEENIVIELPKGWSVVGAPAEAQASGPFGSYGVHVEQSAGRVLVQSKLSLAVARVPAASYAEFRRFCEAVDAAFERRLVLGPE